MGIALQKSTDQALEQKFRRDPAKYYHNESLFLMLTLVTDLQWYCGVRYNPAKIDVKPGDPYELEDQFIHGAIQGPGGTCATLPVVHVALGRRVGYPVYVVNTRKHVFCRWEDPLCGGRVNIEGTTYDGLNLHSDDHYRKWPMPFDVREERFFGYLQSLTPREELASFLGGSRATVAESLGEYMMAVEAKVAAIEIDPHPSPRYEVWLARLVRRWGDKLKEQGRIGDRFRCPTTPLGPRRWPVIPWPWEAEIISLEAAEQGREPRWCRRTAKAS